MILDRLEKQGLIRPPPFLTTNTHYLTIMGSHAYGVADTTVKFSMPDIDVYGFCIPPKNYVFPHLRGEIPGFGTAGPTFDQWQKTGIPDPDAAAARAHDWDFQIFSIVKYFELCRQNNPNMLDSLFTHETCVLHCTAVGRMVRDKRHLFLSKQAWKKFRGYAWSQLHKMETKDPTGGRREIIERWGFDIKFAYHVVRLLEEVEQILREGTVDLMRCKDVLKAIRRGEWTAEQVKQYAAAKDQALEAAYAASSLPEVPSEEELRTLLLACLEEHYGSLSGAVADPGWAEGALREVDRALAGVRAKLYGDG